MHMGRKRVNLAYELNGKAVPKAQGQALALDASRAFAERQERNEQVRVLARRPTAGDTANVRFAMRCVEHRIVKGLWVLELTLPADGPKQDRRNGLGYTPDDVDHWAEAVAKGGWQPAAPRPAVPSSREIDAAKEAKTWIEWLDEEQRRFLIAAAMTKRGDRARRINWERVMTRLPQLRDQKLRTLQDRYDRALRTIVAELTIQQTVA